MGKIDSFKFTDRQGRSILIRNAVTDDALMITDLKYKLSNELLYMLREPSEANYSKENETEDILFHTDKEDALYLVAVADSKVIGQLNFSTGDLIRTKHCGNFTVRIEKKFRESGIGKCLINSLLDFAEKNPVIEKITLHAFSTNDRALKLYESCGFVREGYCPKDMKLSDGSYIDSVLMYKFVK